MNILLVAFIGLSAYFKVVLGTPVPNTALPEQVRKGLVRNYDLNSALFYAISKSLLAACVQWPVKELARIKPEWNTIAFTTNATVTFSKPPIPFNPSKFYCGIKQYKLFRVNPGTVVTLTSATPGNTTWAFAGNSDYVDGSIITFN